MFKNTKIRFLTLVLSTVVLAACGGGSSSSGGGAPDSSESGRAPDGSSGSIQGIEGTAAKGIVKQGTVGLYAIVDGRVEAEPLVTTHTDENGHYSFSYNGAYQGPAQLKLTASDNPNNPTVMTCDVKPDCGEGIAFGDDFELESDFSLFAVIPEIKRGDDIAVNITALTDIAATFALSQSEVSSTGITSANDHVARLFQLEGAIISIPTVDITNAELVAAADPVAVKNALLSAGVLKMLQENSELGLHEKLRRFRLLYKRNEGKFPIEKSSVDDITFFELLDAAISLGESIGVKAEVIGSLQKIKNSVDTDGDGLGDLLDAFPKDPDEQYDRDSDGVGANQDACDDDPTDIVDRDGDGVCDKSDVFPNDSSEWVDSDGDTFGDNSDGPEGIYKNDPDEHADSDGDGVGDNADVFPYKRSEWADTDGDGIGDNTDLFPEDPNESDDRDGDGVPDNADAFPYKQSEWADSDEDGVGDNSDNCPAVFNDQENNQGTEAGDACEDTDGDGVLDIVDSFPTDPTKHLDSDSDGLADSEDNCPFVANSNQLDSYGSPAGDVCDDSDSDGAVDSTDNCPEIANPDQANSAGSSAGDACENSDEDSFFDIDDNCPSITNPDQSDGYGTSLGDVCEDSDGDGVLDSEDAYPDDATKIGDSDGDGVDDLDDAFPDDPNKWDPSPYMGSYKIFGDGALYIHNLPNVNVQKNGKVVWSYLNQYVSFYVLDDGSFSISHGVGTISGLIRANETVGGDYFLFTGETGTIWGYKLSPFHGNYRVSAEGELLGLGITFTVDIEGGWMSWTVDGINYDRHFRVLSDGVFEFTDIRNREFRGVISDDGTVTGSYTSDSSEGSFTALKQ